MKNACTFSLIRILLVSYVVVLSGCGLAQVPSATDGDGVADKPDVDIEQVPDETLNASVCVFNNVAAYPVTLQAEFISVPPIVETLQYQRKTCHQVPNTEGDTIVYSIWAQRTPVLYLHQALLKGHYYQVYFNRSEHKLEVYEIPKK